MKFTMINNQFSIKVQLANLQRKLLRSFENSIIKSFIARLPARQENSKIRKLKIKKVHPAIPLALLAYIVFLVLRTPTGTTAAWWSDTYGYRKPIRFTNSGAAVDAERQVKVDVDTATLISEGKMQADCDDTRFIVNGTEAEFYINDSVAGCDNASTDYYVTLPNVSAGPNVIWMYYSNSSASNSETYPWFMTGGLDNVVAAYDAIGATDLSDSYTNEANPGTYDASLGVAPSWASGTGWTFDGSTEYLATGVVPTGTYTMLVRLSDLQTPDSLYRYIFGQYTSGARFDILHRTESSAERYLWGSSTQNSGEGFITSGVIGMAGDQPYYNGSADGGAMGGSFGTASNDIYIGATNGTGTYSGVSVQAAVIYSDTLSAGEVSSLTTAMNNLDENGVPLYSPSSGPTVGSEEQAPSPAAYWKFDEGTGTTAYDTSDNANDASIRNATWQTEDMCINGKCLYFDGDEDYIDIADSGSLDFSSGGFTVMAWVKANSLQSGDFVQLIDRETDVGSEFSLLFDTGAEPKEIRWYVNDGDWQYTESTTTFTAPTDWIHVAGVHNGTQIILYINGIQNGTPTTQGLPSNTSGQIRIGNGQTVGNLGRDLDGFIDEVKIYPYALSAAQIKTQYAGMAGKRGSSAVLGAALQSESLSEGLIGYWKMDESSGDRSDSSGNNVTFTDINTVTSETGKFGNSADFESTNSEYLTQGAFSGLDSASEFTVSAWVNSESETTSSSQTILGIGAGDFSGTTLGLYRSSGNSYFRAFRGTGPVYITSSQWTATNDVWRHVTLVFNGNESNDRRLRIYRDGVLDTSATITGTVPTSFPSGSLNMTAGAISYQGGGNYFDGNIDETRIYNRALSPVEVRRLYEWAPGPVGHWKMDDEVSGTSQTILDNSGNGNNGTTSGAASDCTVIGRYGGGCYFTDASNDHIDLGTVDAFNLNDNFTVEAWVKDNTTANANHGIFTRLLTSGSGADGYALVRVSGPKWVFVTGDNSSFDSLNEDNVHLADTWYHLTAVVDNGTKYLYVDGVKQSNTSTPASIGSGSIDANIGAYYANYTNEFTAKASIDDVKIYNYPRTQKQIIDDMNAGHPGVGSPIAHAVGEWSFDEGYGTTTYDEGLGDTDGTLTGMASPATPFSGWQQATECKKGKCLKFDGSDDYIEIGTGPTEVNSASFWVNPASTTEYFINFTGTTDYIWSNGGTVTATGFTSPTIYVNGIESSTLTADTWQHVVVTTDTSENASSLRIGRVNGSDYMEGKLDEVHLYNYTLSQDDVKLLFNLGAGQVMGAQAETQEQPDKSRLVSWWDMDEESGNRADDHGGYTLTDNATVTYSTDAIQGNAAEGAGGSSGEKLTRANADDLNYLEGSNSWTMAGWLYADTLPSSHMRALSQLKSGDNQFLFYREYNVAGSKLAFYVWDDLGGNASSLTTSDISAGTWYFTALRYDAESSSVILRVDDTNYTPGTLASDVNASAAALTFGNYEGATTGYWDGRWDEWTAWNTYLSDEELNWLYNSGTGRTYSELDTNNESTTPVAEWSFDELTGSTANDESGNANTGTIIGSSWKRAGECKYGGCLSFDGDDDYIDAGSSSSIDNLTDTTVSAWIKFDGSHVGASDMITSKWNGSNTGWYYDIKNSSGNYTIRLRWYRATTLHDFYFPSSGGLTLTDGWHHVAFTHDRENDQTYFYLDGMKRTDTSESAGSGDYTDDNAQQLLIGGTNKFDGEIDQVKIYDYALSPAQIAYEYDGGGPVAHWKFDECAGTTAYDSSTGGGNDATIYPGGAPNSSVGTCGSGNSDEMWANGETGRFNYSLDFDDTDDYVKVTYDGTSTPNGFSLGGWINTDTVISGTDGVMQWAATPSSGSPFLYLQRNTATLVPYVDAGYKTASPAITAGSWNHFTFVMTSSNYWTFYLNGTPFATFDSGAGNTYQTNANDIYFGNGFHGYFNGRLDDWQLYWYPLSDAQVRKLYNEGSAVRFGPEEGSP